MNKFCAKALGLYKITEAPNAQDENDSWQEVSVKKSLGSSSKSDLDAIKPPMIVRQFSSTENESNGGFSEIGIQKRVVFKSIGARHAHLNDRHFSQEGFDISISSSFKKKEQIEQAQG